MLNIDLNSSLILTLMLFPKAFTLHLKFRFISTCIFEESNLELLAKCSTVWATGLCFSLSILRAWYSMFSGNKEKCNANMLQNILVCVPQKKRNHVGLKIMTMNKWWQLLSLNAIPICEISILFKIFDC